MERSKTLRRVGSAALLLIATLTLLAAALATYAWTAVADPAGLEARVQQARRSPAVQQALANVIVTRAVERAAPDLVAARPLLQQIVAGTIAAPPFDPIFREAAFELHRTLFAPKRAGIVFDLADSGAVLGGVLRAFAPQVAARIPQELHDGVLVLSEQRYGSPLVGSADRVRLLAILLPLLAVVCFALAVVVAPDRHRATAGVGAALWVVACILAISVIVGRQIFVGTLSDRGDTVVAAAGAIWDIVLGPLWQWIAALAVTGTLLIVAGASVNVVAVARRAAHRAIAPPATSRGAALRAITVLVLGVAVIVNPLGVLRLGLIAVGLLATAAALSEILQLIERGDRAPAATGATHSPAPPRRTHGRAIVGAIAVLGLLAAGESQVRGAGSPPASAADIEVCNGYAQLCDRPITDVAFAATHNSMSAASEPGWLNAAQDGGILAQLDFGIRGFLIDTHYGVPNARGDKVRTDLSYHHTTRALLVQHIGEPAVAAAERLLGGPLGYDGAGGPRRPYLCHFLCELGATPLVPALAGLRQWLERHPHEVIVLIIEDAISPEDTAQAFAASGLLQYAYARPHGAPWPTLRQLIAADKRVLVMAEEDNGNGRYPWYESAFSIVQETPYAVPRPDAFTCVPNRGSSSNPFFLLNHWIAKEPPRVTDAEQVNAREFLLARAQKCERERGRLPNIVAINFYERGDVLGVVDALNRVAVTPAS